MDVIPEQVLSGHANEVPEDVDEECEHEYEEEEESYQQNWEYPGEGIIRGLLIERDDAGLCGYMMAIAGRKCSSAKLNALSYANLAAGLGGFANLWLKCTMMLIWVSLGDTTIMEFKYVGTWVVVIITLVFLVIQLYFLNMGLAKHESITIIPIYQGLFLLHTMLVGGIYFNEFESLDSLSSVMFPIGMAITVVGLFILTSREKIVVPGGSPRAVHHTGSMDEVDFFPLDASAAVEMRITSPRGVYSPTQSSPGRRQPRVALYDSPAIHAKPSHDPVASLS